MKKAILIAVSLLAVLGVAGISAARMIPYTALDPTTLTDQEKTLTVQILQLRQQTLQIRQQMTGSEISYLNGQITREQYDQQITQYKQQITDLQDQMSPLISEYRSLTGNQDDGFHDMGKHHGWMKGMGHMGFDGNSNDD